MAMSAGDEALAILRKLNNTMCSGVSDSGSDMSIFRTGGAGMSGAMYPAAGAGGGFPPTLNLPGCPVRCDPCAFPSLDTDLRLFSWPQIDNEMWDTFTQLDVIVDGAFPLNAGDPSITLQQEADRNLTWIPSCVQISTTWSGGNPQPGLLSYQWAVGPKNSTFPTGQVLFANIFNGKQYEPNDQQTVALPFPTYKGCDTQVIGALSALQLIISISPVATSVLEAITVTAFHKRGETPQKVCGLGGSEYYKGGSCGTGGCG